MINDTLILVFISNNPQQLMPLWQVLTKEYQCMVTDSMYNVELHSLKKNDCIYHRRRK
jgi:hypothetical protein